jgi:hypothetical protein
MYNPAPGEDAGQLYGALIWHVKQHNNGTSFLGFYHSDLKYISKTSLLAEYNEYFFDKADQGNP